MTYTNDKWDYQLYVLAEIAYSDACRERGVDDPDEHMPEGWYGWKDYHAKVELLALAMDRNVFVDELPEFYQQYHHLEEK